MEAMYVVPPAAVRTVRSSEDFAETVTFAVPDNREAPAPAALAEPVAPLLYWLCVGGSESALSALAISEFTAADFSAARLVFRRPGSFFSSNASSVPPGQVIPLKNGLLMLRGVTA